MMDYVNLTNFVVAYLLIGVMLSFLVTAGKQTTKGFSKGVFFLGVLLYYVISVVSWPKELVDEFL